MPKKKKKHNRNLLSRSSTRWQISVVRFYQYFINISPAPLHWSHKWSAKKSCEALEKTKRKMLMLLKLLQFNFSFTLKRSETTYCMLHCVIAILCNYEKWDTVNLLKSLAEVPTFICPINPHKIAHRCRSEDRWMTQERALITICHSMIITATMSWQGVL